MFSAERLAGIQIPLLIWRSELEGGGVDPRNSALVAASLPGKARNPRRAGRSLRFSSALHGRSGRNGDLDETDCYWLFSAYASGRMSGEPERQVSNPRGSGAFCVNV
jgi:hypothetical protein